MAERGPRPVMSVWARAPMAQSQTVSAASSLAQANLFMPRPGLILESLGMSPGSLVLQFLALG